MSDDFSGDEPPEHDEAGALRWVFASAGGMTPLLRDLDWTRTSLGPPATWPQSLQSAASICLGAKYPIAIYWGDDLSLIYNEAWSAIPGDKHPWALGRPAAEVWPDIWHIVGPEFEKALDGEGTFVADRLLPMQRRGFVEETYFNYNLSPIVAEDGRIAGVFNAGLETTARVVAQRRQELLLGLTAAASRTSSVDELCDAIAATLCQHRAEVPLAQLYLFDEGEAHLAATTVDPTAASPSTVSLQPGGGPDPWRLREVAATRSHVDIEGIGALAEAEPVGDWPDPPDRAVVVPVLRGGRRSTRPLEGALVIGVPPGLVVDDRMRTFHGMLSDELASALLDVRRDEEERRLFEVEHRVAATLQRSLIPALPELESVGLDGRYLPGAAGVEVGGDWYGAVELPDGRVGLVIGDVVGKGVAAAAQMGQLSNAVRAYMLEGFSPGEVLNRLDRLTHSVVDSTFVTVLCLDYDPRSGELRWSRAGHLPALVRSADGTVRSLDEPGSAPIGVFDDIVHAEWSTDIAPGDVVVLYTDGLVERTDEDIDVGIDRLSRAVGAAEVDDSFADAVVAEVAGDDRRDDIALLVLRA